MVSLLAGGRRLPLVYHFSTNVDTWSGLCTSFPLLSGLSQSFLALGWGPLLGLLLPSSAGKPFGQPVDLTIHVSCRLELFVELDFRLLHWQAHKVSTTNQQRAGLPPSAFLDCMCSFHRSCAASFTARHSAWDNKGSNSDVVNATCRHRWLPSTPRTSCKHPT